MKQLIDAEELKAEIERRIKSIESCPFIEAEFGAEMRREGKTQAYNEILSLITSLQQEENIKEQERERRYQDARMEYWSCVLKTIDSKRILPTFKGQLLHDFKNELHTMKQVVGLINHPEIPEGLFNKLALVFATWGGYHFHPEETEIEDSLQQEQPEVDLEKFTDKIKTFQERYKHPEIVSIKGAMAFMARMFYQYPNVARQWYDSLPKATMD